MYKRQGIIHAQADLYVQNLLSTITECGLDTRAMPTIFIGGGAALMKRLSLIHIWAGK